MVTVEKHIGKWWCKGPRFRPASGDRNFGTGRTREAAMVAYARRNAAGVQTLVAEAVRP